MLAFGLAGADRLDDLADRAARDSVRNLHPRQREFWLRDRGLVDPFVFGTIKPESTGLRLVGKYGRGSAVEVTGRDSLVVLTLGSEVAIVSFGRPDSPVVLSEIQFGSVTVQSRLCDSVLYIGGYGAVEAWDVSDPMNPEYLSRIPLGVSDFCVQDTFLYFMRQDTFRVFSVADPAAPRQLGWYRDSAVVFAVSGNTVVCGHPRQGVILVDVSDPTLPHRVGSVPGWALSAEVRGNLCCATYGNENVPDELTLRVLDISDPSAPRQLGSINYCGGYDMCLGGQYLFLSGYYTGDYGFQVVDVSDSTHPRLVGECVTDGQGWGVWTDLSAQRGYVAGKYGGLIEIDISAPANPSVIGSMLHADAAYDVAVTGSLAYVADRGAGLHILDLSDPSRPRQLGVYDTAGFLPGTQTCAVRDSFAFANWYDGGGSRRYLRSVDVSDPANPTFAGDAECLGPPEHVVLEDSFLYVAEAYRFQVFNVSRPRHLGLAGGCVIGVASDLVLAGSLAVASRCILDISDPTSPVWIGIFPVGGYGCAVRDTFVFFPATYDSFLVYSISDPEYPRRISSIRFSSGHVGNQGVAMTDNLVYVGGDVVHVVDVADPAAPREVGRWVPPYDVRRLQYSQPYLYAACYNAGICVLESVPTGVAEPGPSRLDQAGMLLTPNPSSGVAVVSLAPPLRTARTTWAVFDATGRQLAAGVPHAGAQELRLDLRGHPSGVYVVELVSQGKVARSKLVKN